MFRSDNSDTVVVQALRDRPDHLESTRLQLNSVREPGRIHGIELRRDQSTYIRRRKQDIVSHVVLTRQMSKGDLLASTQRPSYLPRNNYVRTPD